MELNELVQGVKSGLESFKTDASKSITEQKAALDALREQVEKIEKLDGVAKAADVEQVRKDFDELAAKLNEGGFKDKKEKKTLRQLMAEGVEKHKEVLQGVQAGSLQGKGNYVIELVEKDMSYAQNFEDHDIFTADIRNQVIQSPLDPFQARQIIGVGSTTGDVVHFPKLTGKIGSGPAPWAYGTGDGGATVAKPEFSPTFEPYSTPVEWIAGIIRVPIQMLQDLSWLTSFLQTWGVRQLADEETNQVFNGNGSSPNLTGILDVAPTYGGGYSNPIEILVDATLGTLGASNYVATHIVMNPQDVVPIILNKASQSGVYNLPNGAVGVVNGRLTINGLSVVVTNKIAQGTWLAGDFRQAQIVQRMAPQLRFFEQDVDNVQKNMITVRVEERIALAIFDENAFVQGAFGS